MLKLVTVMMLIVFVNPALAASEYWVVQSDPSVRKCTVVQTEPQPGKTETPPAGTIVGVPYQNSGGSRDPDPARATVWRQFRIVGPHGSADRKHVDPDRPVGDDEIEIGAVQAAFTREPTCDGTRDFMSSMSGARVGLTLFATAGEVIE